MKGCSRFYRNRIKLETQTGVVSHTASPMPERETVHCNSENAHKSSGRHSQFGAATSAAFLTLYCNLSRQITMLQYSHERPRRCDLHAPPLPRHPTTGVCRSPLLLPRARHDLRLVRAIPQTRTQCALMTTRARNKESLCMNAACIRLYITHLAWLRPSSVIVEQPERN